MTTALSPMPASHWKLRSMLQETGSEITLFPVMPPGEPSQPEPSSCGFI